MEMESTMVAKTNSARRMRKTGPAMALTEYIPITSGPVRELTDADFDKIDARLDELQRYRAEVLASLKALNAEMGVA
jgi:hypothetical protein